MRTLLAVTIALTFLLINLGGHVHNTHSSLACPDWPLCFGQFMPVMEKGVLIEHSHRLLASLVGLLTLLMAFLARNLAIKRIAILAVLMVILQGLLGGLTVIYKLPPIISTAHLGLAMGFFCTLIYLHHKLKPDHENVHRSLLIRWALPLLFIQLLLGAFVRHIGAGTVCGLGDEHRLLCLGDWLPETWLQLLHMSHRGLGLIVAILLVLVCMEGLRRGHFMKGVILLSLLLGQLWLGTQIISTAFMPLITLLHLTFATLILAMTFKINLLQKRN